jgi:DNA-binding response OmpR family regulator
MNQYMAEHSSQKVLIIEADGEFAGQLRDALTRQGYSPVVAQTGEEGLKAMLDTLPHVIIVGATLLSKDGYKVLEEKSKEPVLSKIPVFLISAEGEPITMEHVPQGSVSEFLLGPHARISNIISTINSYLANTTMPPQAVPESKSPKKKVLWVEDDKLIGTILAKKIISSGFELYHAKNGEEALQLLSQVTPDMIAVDLMLPGMSGFDILQKVQMDETKRKIPTMVLSNLSKPSDIEKARMLGAKKFLVKAATSLDQIVAEMKELCK